ncbi:hypothetical protein M8998_14090 [Sphingobacterium sp. lm-10]|uniref:MbnP family protein n=1 Tax=Sphingobacterium sp. lm-10 TaxID=2944904 RepID=UPI00202062D0|nr:MbnP family protein [Sphingobacterium sp. lm-10]MCL7989075.1 hypothetical protein [Sphingobacterium sp. lm-10]
MKKYISGVALLTAILSGCNKTEIQEVIVPADQGNTLNLQFENRYGDQDFELLKRYAYQENDADFELAFERLRYWVSNVKLISTSGEEVAIPNSYYLIEETEAITVPHLIGGQQYPGKKRDAVNIKNIPSGTYQGLKFSIGVEPKYNDNITLTAGELGILNGMGFSDGWMWFTSYIFQKMDARMYSGTEQRNLRWDSGSNALFEGAEKNINFPNAITLNEEQGLQVDLRIDVRQLLSTTLDPWRDNVISQSRPEMMRAFRDALLQRGISLQRAENIRQK